MKHSYQLKEGVPQLVKWFKELFFIKCPDCKKKGVSLLHEERLRITTINVYECKYCKNKFV